VVVTTRNSAQTIERCLRSVDAQTYPAVELIVVDNGSTDGTREIAESHADIVLDHGTERSAQRNAGVDRATGEYVLIVDADMELTPNVVMACVSAAHEQNASVVTVPEVSVGEGFWAACRALERRCYLGDETVEAPRFFRRSVYLAYGGYDETLTGPEDWDLPARMRGRERFARSAAPIVHDEGRLRLGTHLRKKYYYGRTFNVYVRRHPGLAARQLLPLRPAFLRNWRLLARQPILTGGIIVLKLAEFAAGGAGLVSARLALGAR